MTDWRLPEHRMQVFCDFYEFHLRYRAHPGAVYHLMPWLAYADGYTDTERLWFALVNGHTQNPFTTWIIVNEFDDPHNLDGLDAWFRRERHRLAWDTDRRYHRRQFPDAVRAAVTLGACQAEQWDRLSGSPADCWTFANALPTFGRLSTWSYLEYVRIMGWDVDVPGLMLADITGSRSHRNGLCILAGLDELDWRGSGHHPNYTPHIPALLDKAMSVLTELSLRAAVNETIPARDIGYLTLESTLCTFKGWHRPDRRYPNVYNDMAHDRIRAAESAWPELDFGWAWHARSESLPAGLRLECEPNDPGVHPLKQNWYRETGEVPMLAQDWPARYPCGLAAAALPHGPFRAPAQPKEYPA